MFRPDTPQQRAVLLDHETDRERKHVAEGAVFHLRQVLFLFL